MRRRAEALPICSKERICFPRPENPCLSAKHKVTLNYQHGSYQRAGSAQHGETFCGCRKNTAASAGCFLETTPQPSCPAGRAAGEARHTAGRGSELVADRLYTTPAFTWAHLLRACWMRRFWLARIKKEQSVFCLLLQHVQSCLQGHYSSRWRAHEVLSQYGWEKGRLHRDKIVKSAAGGRSPSITLALFGWYGVQRT